MITRQMMTIKDDRTTPIFTTPHYLHNPSYARPKTVWGQEANGLTYNYSDRIWQWDYNKADRCHKQATAVIKSVGCADWYELFLRLYFENKSLKLIHVLAGHNLATGYPYAVYGYKDGGKEQ